MFSSRVDNIKVQNIINSTVAYELTLLGGTFVDAPTLHESWQALMAQRRTPEYCNSYDLAAAEHYCFAAYLTAATGDPIAQLAPRLYDIKKRWKFLWNDERSMRTDLKYPVLEPDVGVEGWGIKGAQDGLNIYKANHPGAPLHPGASVEGLMNDAGYSKDTSKSSGDAAKKLATILSPYL